MSSDPRFVFGVDLDGVVFDLTSSLRRHVATILDINPDVLGPVTEWNIGDWKPHVSGPKHLTELIHLSASYGMFADLEPIPGAVDALNRIADLGAHIRIITHRDGPDMRRIVADTASSLARHGVPFDGLCFEGAKIDIAADLYIDDAPHNLRAYHEHGRRAIAFCNPPDDYLGNAPGIRAHDWRHVVRVVESVMEADRAGDPNWRAAALAVTAGAH